MNHIVDFPLKQQADCESQMISLINKLETIEGVSDILTTQQFFLHAQSQLNKQKMNAEIYLSKFSNQLKNQIREEYHGKLGKVLEVEKKLLKLER